MPGPSDNNQAELQHAPVCQSHKDCQLHWYAVRVTYSRELSLKDYLDKENIENFIPMRYEYVIRNERRVRKLVPAIHNLVFLRSTRSRIDEIKNNPVLNIPVRYIMNRETHQPVIIPDAQMRSFILVAGTYDEAVIYVEPEELKLVKGTKVRITGGVFEGSRGRICPSAPRPPCGGEHRRRHGSSHYIYSLFAYRTDRCNLKHL